MLYVQDPGSDDFDALIIPSRTPGSAGGGRGDSSGGGEDEFPSFKGQKGEKGDQAVMEPVSIMK